MCYSNGTIEEKKWKLTINSFDEFLSKSTMNSHYLSKITINQTLVISIIRVSSCAISYICVHVYRYIIPFPHVTIIYIY